MKMKHAIVGSVLSGLASPAIAERTGLEEARAFAIVINSDATPLRAPDIRYPLWAGARALEGSCRVTFKIAVDGHPDAVEVAHCSSAMFRRSARSIVEQMRFSPSGTIADVVSMDIRWTFSPAPVETAALR